MEQHEKDHEELIWIASYLDGKGLDTSARWLKEFADGYLWEKS